MDIPFSLAILISIFTLFTGSKSFDFLCNGFNGSYLVLEGATVLNTGALKLTNKSHRSIGHAFYPKPVPILNSSTTNVISFSTYFVFSIMPFGGYGFGFTLSPFPGFPGAQGDQYLGVFNSQNDGKDSNHVFMVEFDTVNGFNEGEDSDGNHIGININGMESLATEPASYYVNGTWKKEELKLQSGEPIQAWIDYDGTMNVTISPINVAKPRLPLISKRVNLSAVMKEKMYAGFSSATGEKSKATSHYILGWSFRLDGPAPSLNLSSLPIPPPENETFSHKSKLKTVLIPTLSSLLLLLLVAGVCVAFICKRVRHFEVLEDWELDCPHRFQFKDLYTATMGFKDNELIGVGGFGAVYKGVIPTTGTEVAVKKISKNSLQGVKEFVAEIESLGRLRHKNLVNLQGWCKKKNDLLLVYDYVPNGSLDSLLYRPKTHIVLTWEQRWNIIKGIAAGLLYLHEEWEQVVVHRDVKSSNVLIDGEMNPRLGDFGLARLYDHNKDSHTTNVVGTIGYIAPELTRTGKPSTATDVFAYGVLLLEVACGRPPVVYKQDQGHVALGDWVTECCQRGAILEAVDPKLCSRYEVEEVTLVLGLGLVCSHPKAEARPTMRHVMRYLNGDESFGIDDAFSSLGSTRVDEITCKFLEAFSKDTISTSYHHSSSMGEMSSTSLEDGR